MPDQYLYRVLGADGEVREGSIVAANEDAVLEHFAEKDVVPIEIKAAGQNRGVSMWGFFGRRQYEDLIAFTTNLRTLYKAGVPLLRALAAIKVGPTNGRFNQVIDRLRMAVQSGKTLSQALSDYNDVFPRIYAVSIAAGEESGKLDQILEQLSAVLAQEYELTRQIKSGIRYPAMVVGAIGLAFIVLMTFVVPRFVEFYSAFDAELPFVTQLLIGTSNFMSTYWYVMLGLAATLVVGFRKAAGIPASRLAIDRFMLRLPAVGQLIIKGNVARFALMFRTLLKAGLPMIHSLGILNDTIKNTAIAREIAILRDLLEEGRDNQLLDQDFECLPELSRHMMAIGLESGSLDSMLEELGNHYAREVSHASRQLTAVLEPILTLVMGVFVLLLALAIFLPMWNLIQVFQK